MLVVMVDKAHLQKGPVIEGIETYKGTLAHSAN